MLWEECIPKGFYDHIKKPENFELLNSEKLTFKQVKNIVYAYVQLRDIWSEILCYVSVHHSIYRYVYSLLFPKYYTRNNKYGVQSKIKCSLCFEKLRQRKMNEKIGKNPFNFHVVEEVVRHPYEQKPITNDDEFRDVIDTKKVSSENKENIPPSPHLGQECNQKHVYAATMSNIKQFDKRFKLPKVKKVSKTALEKAEKNEKSTRTFGVKACRK